MTCFSLPAVCLCAGEPIPSCTERLSTGKMTFAGSILRESDLVQPFRELLSLPSERQRRA